MTIEQQMIKLLEKHGMWHGEAEIIIGIAINDKSLCLEAMSERWEDDTEGYPPELLASIWYHIKQIALRWIDQNKPEHFAKYTLS